MEYLEQIKKVLKYYENAALDAAKSKISYQEYLYILLQRQIIDGVDRSINAQIKKAGFHYLIVFFLGGSNFGQNFHTFVGFTKVRDLIIGAISRNRK